MHVITRFLALSLTMASLLIAGSSFAQDPTVIVQNAYQDILGRPADQSGLRNFRSKIIDEGWSEAQVRDALRNSDEFKQHHADTIIKRAYEDILGREPDPAGLIQYRKFVMNEHWTERQVRDSLRQSQEYKNKHR